ncbi:MAG: hypothetical protein H0V89_11875 [Deltaproteobacteria bacterium]|nr:hypothetical protein [Deltaproteobacteria bacterium]
MMFLTLAAFAQDPSAEVCVETEIRGPPDHPAQRAEAARDVRFAINRGTVPRGTALDASAVANLLPISARPDIGEDPVAFFLDGVDDPFVPGHVRVRVAARGRDLAPEALLPVHVVFIVETAVTTGSATTRDLTPDGPHLYSPRERVRVVREAIREWLLTWDRPGTISLLAYDGQVLEVLPTTPIEDRETILAAVARLDVGLAPKVALAGHSALPEAIAQSAKRPAPCEDHRIVVFTDGPQVETSAGEPVAVAASRLRYSRLSVVILPAGPRRAPEYERLAEAGRGVGWYADTTWEVRQALSRGILPPRRVASRVDWTVAFDPAQIAWAEPLGPDPSGRPLATGEQITWLYDVMLRPDARPDVPLATVQWTGDFPGWRTPPSGTLALAPSHVATWETAHPDLRAATTMGAFVDLLQWRAAIHDWDTALAAVPSGPAPAQEEMHAWLRDARKTWPGTFRWPTLPFGVALPGTAAVAPSEPER